MENKVMDLITQSKGVVFDLDGVLVDTAIYHFQAWKRLANELGIDFTAAENEQLKGVSRMQSLEKILHWGRLDLEEKKKLLLAAQRNVWYLEFIQQMDEGGLLPGARELLIWLHDQRFKVALGSASKNAKLILQRTGIESLFDAVVDGNVVNESKPNPEVFLRAATYLGLDPHDCLVFEDAQAGIDAGRAAGMMVVGVGVDLVRADALINGLDEIFV